MVGAEREGRAIGGGEPAAESDGFGPDASGMYGRLSPDSRRGLLEAALARAYPFRWKAVDQNAEQRRVAMANLLPAIFFGHGNPMNAIGQNSYTDAWRRIGQGTARPKAVLSVSAHWYVPETGVTIGTAPRTIHDFGGFPRELYQVQYPAPGDPALARRVQQLLAPLEVKLDPAWGLDHGTWSVLKHVYPAADVPIVQLSIDETKPASFHFDIGRKLAPLRDEDVLIVGSGNIVHNLHAYAWGRRSRDPYDWAVRFEATAKKMMRAREYTPLIDYEKLGRDAMLSIPTPDHYLPLLYVLAAGQVGDRLSFPVEGVDGGSISMLAVQMG
jgi:4,5-DOPA dioxygenase extradiol